MVLTNRLGRPKAVSKFKSVFDFVQSYIIPNKEILERLMKDRATKQKQLDIAEGKVTLQTTKINKAYEDLIYFKKWD